MIELGVVNVGAAGTFGQAELRQEFLRRLPFETEVMVCSANEVLQLASTGAFASEPSGPDIVRFVSVLPRRRRVPVALPINSPLARIGWFVFSPFEADLRLVLPAEYANHPTAGPNREAPRLLGHDSQLEYFFQSLRNPENP